MYIFHEWLINLIELRLRPEFMMILKCWFIQKETHVSSRVEKDIESYLNLLRSYSYIDLSFTDRY